MWTPNRGWRQQSSFPERVAIPDQAPQSSPYVYISFNATWLPYVLGCLQQLTQPGTWITTSQAELDSVLGEAQDLLAQIAAANGPQPPIFQVTAAGLFQVSTDGGVTWVTVLPWAAYPPGYAPTPVPIEAGAGTLGNGGTGPIVLNQAGGVAVRKA
jgi:hypothetical protein